MDFDISGIITALAGALGGGTLAFFSRSGKTKARVEALRIADDHIAYKQAVIDRQDRALDDKTLQIRSLTQKLWESEQAQNRLAERNHEQQERIMRLLLEAEHWKHWHCRRCDCLDPRGREPQQDPPEQRYLPYTPAGENEARQTDVFLQRTTRAK